MKGAIAPMSQTTSPPAYFSFEEYLAYDDGTDTSYELVDGALVEMPPESDENLDIARRLLLELIKHLPAERVVWGTEIEVTGRRATCRLPDLLVHTEESKAALAGKGRATITRDMPPPALVIEIVSPGKANRDRDYRYKYIEYAARAIAEYWIVDPEDQKVTVCQWVEGLYEDTVYAGSEPIQSEIVPNLALTPDVIFA
jgi:Uma2 family endonuclease